MDIAGEYLSTPPQLSAGKEDGTTRLVSRTGID